MPYFYAIFVLRKCNVEASIMKKFLKLSLLLLLFIVVLGSCTKVENGKFINIKDGKFQKNGESYYYVGTNFWYGGILGSLGQGGDRARLTKELDLLSSIGVKNLRVIVGADGDARTSKVQPSLQLSPGVYNDTLLQGLDYLLVELRKRDMEAVLFLNNSWEWSGGYSQYLEWAGKGVAPVPAETSWDVFRSYVTEFAVCREAQELFFNYVRDIVGRTNSISGVKYSEEPAIMAWQIGNEPRAFSDKNKEPFKEWVLECATLIKSLDKNHLVSVGSEGEKGCEEDIELFEAIHQDKNIDYLTIHCWPKNWSWIDIENIEGTLQNAITETTLYLDRHSKVAQRVNKPMVLEEFGFPRDGCDFRKDVSATTQRDLYYSAVFNLITKNMKEGGHFAGCNFWAWGGYGEPEHLNWQMGDDYVGDPPQEPQGLNSIFASDISTLEIIKSTTKQQYVKL